MTTPDLWVKERLRRSPVRKYRVALKSSRAELARQLKLNDSVIYLTELGCYPNLPVRLYEFFREKEVPLKRLLHEYGEFRKAERKLTGLNFKLDLFEAPEGEPLDPVEALSLYIGGSHTDLGKALCLSPSVLYKIERHVPKTLPLEFRLALLQAGVPKEEVEKLEKNYAY